MSAPDRLRAAAAELEARRVNIPVQFPDRDREEAARDYLIALEAWRNAHLAFLRGAELPGRELAERLDGAEVRLRGCVEP